jgi:hypothetical protein
MGKTSNPPSNNKKTPKVAKASGSPIKKMSRPSPEERKRDKVTKQLINRIDKQYRTRNAKKIQETLKNIEDENPGALEKIIKESEKSKPPKKSGSKNIYSGSWRSFTSDFSTQWWNDQKKPWICAKCKQVIDPKGKGDAAPSIDHIKSWASIKTTIETHIVCTGTVHWDVAFTEDVRTVFQDEKNLQPMHKGCNSAKNGPKNTDSIAPQRHGDCPGDTICQERKASS